VKGGETKASSHISRRDGTLKRQGRRESLAMEEDPRMSAERGEK